MSVNVGYGAHEESGPFARLAEALRRRRLARTKSGFVGLREVLSEVIARGEPTPAQEERLAEIAAELSLDETAVTDYAAALKAWHEAKPLSSAERDSKLAARKALLLKMRDFDSETERRAELRRKERQEIEQQEVGLSGVLHQDAAARRERQALRDKHPELFEGL
jgi:hypothetical protein